MLVQNDSTGSMIHKVADLIAYISTFTSLSAGDVIITGSPGGVGKNAILRYLCMMAIGLKLKSKILVV